MKYIDKKLRNLNKILFKKKLKTNNISNVEEKQDKN